MLSMKKSNGKEKFNHFQLFKDYFLQICYEAFDVDYKRKNVIYQVLTMLCKLSKLTILTYFNVHLFAFDIFFAAITISFSKQKALKLNKTR